MVTTMESMRSTVVAFLLLVSLGMCLIGESRLLAQVRDHLGEWPAYASDKASSKYSPLDQINKENVARLQIAWRQSSIPDEARHGSTIPAPARSQNTPLMVDGLLYISTGLGSIAALDATTGAVVWSADPQRGPGAEGPRGNTTRGVAYWHDRVIAVVGPFLTAFEAKTGERVPAFGDAGVVDLRRGYDDRVVDSYTWRSAPLVVNEVIVVGSFNTDFLAAVQPATKQGPPGDVRGYDVRTGEQLWIFHTIPREGEFGNETWETNPNEDRASWEYSGHTNMWSFPSGDEELGYVYLPLTTPTNDYYGGHRLGDNLFAESLVALDIETGQRMWHFQAVHHGVWDYDFPAAPTLVDVMVGGRPVKAIAQVSKQGFTYVFDRATGDPVWPIEERPVATDSDLEGEVLSPTQPFPTKPPPFDRQGVTEADLIDFTPALRAEAVDILRDYVYGPIFTPPSVIGTGPGDTRGTIELPGYTGGANWNGAAVDPDTGFLYVASTTQPIIPALVELGPDRSNLRYTRGRMRPPAGPDGLPLFKGPYGRITAIDLNRGTIAWQRPNGEGSPAIRDHPRLRDIELPLLGGGRDFLLVTTELLFSGQQTPGRDDTWVLAARDKASGELLAEIPLPGRAIGAPMSYEVEGRQYLALTIRGVRGGPPELVALALP